MLFKYLVLKTTLAIKGDFRDILQGPFKAKHWGLLSIFFQGPSKAIIVELNGYFLRAIESINEDLLRTYFQGRLKNWMALEK